MAISQAGIGFFVPHRNFYFGNRHPCALAEQSPICDENQRFSKNATQLSTGLPTFDVHNLIARRAFDACSMLGRFLSSV
jgi:hypothetical protein